MQHHIGLLHNIGRDINVAKASITVRSLENPQLKYCNPMSFKFMHFLTHQNSLDLKSPGILTLQTFHK